LPFVTQDIRKRERKMGAGGGGNEARQKERACERGSKTEQVCVLDRPRAWE